MGYCGGVDAFETIADRRIREGREAGLFDGLAGAGKPLPDLDRQRPPGWWAARLVARERRLLEAGDLELAPDPRLSATRYRRRRSLPPSAPGS